MIAVSEGGDFERVNRAVLEGMGRLALAESAQHRTMSDCAESQDDLKTRHPPDLVGEEAVAGGDLLRLRLVLGWHTADGVADAAAKERETIIGAGFVRADREFEFLESGVEQVAGIVAREG